MDLSVTKDGETLLRQATAVFWDFDGVIKDSVAVKSEAFEKLFLPYGKDIADRVRKHHEAHGGVSRFEKMPIYLKWAGESVDAVQVQKFCDKFSKLVQQAVINAPWVPGVREYLQDSHSRQHFTLISATPQDEIQYILKVLDIANCFHEVYGAPTPKAMAIHDVLKRLQCPLENVVVVGDSEADFNAAEKNHVSFLLRRTSLECSFLEKYSGPEFSELKYE